MEILERMAKSLEDGDHVTVVGLTETAIEDAVGAAEILNGGLLAGMAVVGRKFRDHEIFLPDVLLAARAMYAGLDLLKPLLVADAVPSRGTVVLGTVRGDQHDIGKNLVGIMLEGAGYRVVDLGVDVSSEQFVEAALNEESAVIGMSALLTTTMAGMGDVIDALHKRAPKVKTIVGGAPVDASFAEQIGADAFGFDASNAVDQVAALIEAG